MDSIVPYAMKAISIMTIRMVVLLSESFSIALDNHERDLPKQEGVISTILDNLTNHARERSRSSD